jgi:pathogenesis-related protein 1
MRILSWGLCGTLAFATACSSNDGKASSTDVGESTGGVTAIASGGTEASGGHSTGTGDSTSVGGASGSGGAGETGGNRGTSGANSDGGSGETGGEAGTGGATGETGRMVGMVEEINVVRAAVSTTPPLPDMTWSDTIAGVAQAYANTLAAGGCNLVHSGNKLYGENLAWFSGSPGTAKETVDLWAGEKACYTYGPVTTTNQCTQCSSCGHYTQLVWRSTTEVGCGVATCTNSEVWVCNFSPPGNYIGETPY